MVTVGGGRRGFYSNILWILGHCNLAEKTNDDIFVENFSIHYSNFYDYFEKFEVDKTKKYPNFLQVKEIEDIRFFKSTEICGFVLDFEIRKYIKFLIDKYLKIKPHILSKIEKYNPYFEKKVIGVHIRQTDLHTSHLDNKLDKPIDLDTYFKKIDENINDFDYIFLMSDNIQSINDFQKRYKNCFYVTEISRSIKNDDNPLFRNNNQQDLKYKLGEDIIIETELLSKCNKIIITNSNISSYALANNPTIKFDYMDLGINDEILMKIKNTIF